MPFTGPAQDKDAIRELYAAYSDASACADVDAFLTCFADDALWNTHVFQRQGKDELRTQWQELWVNFDKVGFLSEVGAIEVEGDSAACRCVAREIIRLKGGGIFKLIGLYRDQLVRENGKWVFSRRDYEPIAEEIPS